MRGATDRWKSVPSGEAIDYLVLSGVLNWLLKMCGRVDLGVVCFIPKLIGCRGEMAETKEFTAEEVAKVSHMP
jgi:hypothetical protein